MKNQDLIKQIEELSLHVSKLEYTLQYTKDFIRQAIKNLTEQDDNEPKEVETSEKLPDGKETACE